MQVLRDLHKSKTRIDPYSYPISIRIEPTGDLVLSQPDLGLYRGLGKSLPTPSELGRIIYEFWQEVYRVAQSQTDPVLPAERITKHEWVSVKQAAQYLGVSESSIRRMCDAGRLETRRISSHRKIRVTSLR